MADKNTIYLSTNAPPTAQQGDIKINQSDNTMEIYSGTAWAAPRFIGLTVDSGGFTVTAGATSVLGPFYTAAGFASTNAATPGFYIPGAAGVPTGAVASLAGRVALYYDTTNSRLCVRNAGSWYASASLAIL